MSDYDDYLISIGEGTDDFEEQQEAHIEYDWDDRYERGYPISSSPNPPVVLIDRKKGIVYQTPDGSLNPQYVEYVNDKKLEELENEDPFKDLKPSDVCPDLTDRPEPKEIKEEPFEPAKQDVEWLTSQNGQRYGVLDVTDDHQGYVQSFSTGLCQADFFLPILDNNNNSIEEEKNEVVRQIEEAFNGITRFADVKGSWRMSDGSITREKNQWYRVILKFSERKKLEKILLKFKEKAKQEAIYLDIKESTVVFL